MDKGGVKFFLLFPTYMWNNIPENVDQESEEGMRDVERILDFVGRMTKQTEEDLAFQRRSDPDDEWVKFLEGKLHAFSLVQGFLEDVRRRRANLH